ncbi:GPW/gp25 family protein [Nocardioides sp. cx-173]|uniref:GPW/gp25 family protein n=1 Tax=Nocardioides sp. cx-173 TaxID=2898796 RepID=UPI001E624646|nr:GPW/gp25 family protein [Nocardioides sp. cx-173]MCD4525971.1 GPW/gp25 family protein [Nocardioides sp. cx-173]UGB43668.1 GPW/gp25 family protein [Nocardioides sp. cx-173]
MHLEHPFHFDGRGRTADATHSGWLRGLVEQVLMTQPGERVNRPTFGSGLRQLPFEGLGDELGSATEFLVQAALQQWLGDLIAVDRVDVHASDSTLRVTVAFTEVRTGEGHVETYEREGVG